MKKVIFMISFMGLIINGFTQPGMPDLGFVTGSGLSNVANAIALQSDGKILVGGDFTQYQDSSRNRLVRILSNGSIDTTFKIGTGFSDVVRDIEVQSDGKIIVVGNFTHFNGMLKPGIVRLLPGGSLDPSFFTGTGLDGLATSVDLQSDGKIIVGGCFNTYSGNSSNGIVRLETNGIFDPTFNIGSGFPDCVNDVTVQTDDKVLVGGYFTQFNGLPSSRLIRLNSTGTLDLGFSTVAGGIVNEVEVQTDGKILVAGNFIFFNGSSVRHLTRLDSNGALDVSWTNSPTGFSHEVFDVEIQSDGSIIAAGLFVSFNGTPRVGCARLDVNGNLDLSFVSNSDGWGVALTIQPNGRILLGGLFTNINGVGVSCLARLLNTVSSVCATAGTLSFSGTWISCSAGSTLVSALFSGGSVDSIRWFKNGLAVAGIAGSGSAIALNRWSTGIYHAVGYCAGNMIFTDSLWVNKVDLRVISGSTALCPGASVTLQAAIVPGASYEWRYGTLSGPVIGTSPTLVVNAPGARVNIWCKIQVGSCAKFGKIGLTLPGDCPGAIPKLTTDQNLNELSFSVYPNPVSDKMLLSFQGIGTTEEVLLRLFDVQGNLVKSYQLHSQELTDPIAIEVMDLQQGIYLLQLVTSNQTLVKRIFKN